ncbi:MAG: C39 family peptidase [Candidatus Campbellbacteria bacterium]|nr:C39 family peptidase [Candidatus Campbellbacteria bacterium]
MSEYKLKSFPFFSQYKDISEEEYKKKACGVVSLAMVLRYFDKNSPSPDELLKEGLKINGLVGVGWKHTSLAILSRNNGLACYLQEFLSHKDLPDEEKKLRVFGIEKIMDSIKQEKPILVSIMNEGRGSHIVVVTGFVERDGKCEKIFYYDPELNEKGVEVEAEKFMEIWRGLCIFFEKY